MSTAAHVWINGSLVTEGEARVSPFDHGLLTGDGVFETLKVVGGRPFAWRRHVERLAGSAQGMGLPLPSVLTLRTAVDAVVAANGLASGRLRITVTGGPSPLGSDRGGDGPTVIVAGGPLPSWPASVDVVVVPWPRNERGALAGLKTISYGENVVALAYARERDAGEALFGNLAGNLCEGTGTNVFVGLGGGGGGRLVTPPLSSGCLAGVTRALLLEAGVAVEEDVALSALSSSALSSSALSSSALSSSGGAGVSEAFVSSTTRDVQPISSIDGVPLPACPGPLTAAAAAAFAEVVRRSDDP
ncbi:MAG: branched-chain amino acid aminotransferase [Acidimicrobiaceae bacterium]|nr:branched-chain amino acid aminotransferase [Acidimicrobiaceae bacterium]